MTKDHDPCKENSLIQAHSFRYIAMRSLLSHSTHLSAEVHYFICKCIFEALEKTDEAKERTLFGGYSSARLRQWQDIIKSYEHNCAYLGEASEMLISSVKYEMYLSPHTCSPTQSRFHSFLPFRLSATDILTLPLSDPALPKRLKSVKARCRSLLAKKRTTTNLQTNLSTSFNKNVQL